MGYRFKIAFCLVLMLVSQWLMAADVKGVRVWRAPDNTRLVFDLSGPVEHKIFTLDSPARLVIDIENAKFAANTDGLDFSGSPIGKMRYGKRNKSDLRVVLDLQSQVKPRSFVLLALADKPDRLVIDLYDEGTATVKTVQTVAKAPESKRDIVIAIDAGHGGEDP